MVNEIPMGLKVLITGGAGSLGTAFYNRLKEDHRVVIVDNNEWAVAKMGYEHSILDDFWNIDVSHYDVVIHCAAYKHVNLGEDNPDAFIENNIVKTSDLFRKCADAGVRFLFISTDKAVEPISLYGMTKAIGEKLALYYGGYIARCGNLLSSSGSVIPLWEKAIEEEQPIPITDERMVRYFSEMHEAANEIWNQFMEGERIIIPAHKKIRMLDMLTEVLKKHGYKKASDYKPGVHVIGMRPGEKLEEKLEWD